MIVTLTGKIDSIATDSCVIEVQGIGYKVYLPATYLEQLREFETEPVKLYIHYYLREDGVSLYGFLLPEDKAIFEQIISVSGVGPKTAQALVGMLSGAGFQAAIVNEDHGALTSVPGVGLKTAQRLILELKGKLSKTYIPAAAGGTVPGLSRGRSEVRDAVDALVALGYSDKEASEAVEGVYRENQSLTTQELVRITLKMMVRK